eukprot:scaffold8818_cov129-Isochrysis_galbana.AAC.2
MCDGGDAMQCLRQFDYVRRPASVADDVCSAVADDTSSRGARDTRCNIYVLHRIAAGAAWQKSK